MHSKLTISLKRGGANRLEAPLGYVVKPISHLSFIFESMKQVENNGSAL
jgi:hypothetical protein